MSFRGTWKTVEQRTVAFHNGSKDQRTSRALLEDIVQAVRECQEAFADGNPESSWLVDFSECEERLASALRDIMLLSNRQGWDIPEAMSARNTILRNKWKQKA